MVQKVRDRIYGSILMIVTGIVVSMFSVGYANSKLDSKEQDEKINYLDINKLSREEYLNDQRSREEKHQKIHDRDREDILYIRTRTDDIYEHLLNTKP
jgi:hypothetical protein